MQSTLSTGEDQKVYITTAGGGQKLYEAEVIDGCFTRTIDATSQAWVRLKVSDRCCGDIQYTQVWRTDLEWYRDGVLVWAGPIRQVNYQDDEIQILATDVSSWWDVRFMNDFSGRGDVAGLFASVIEQGTQGNPIPGMTVISSSVGRNGEVIVLEEQDVTIASVIQELADSDIDWTVVGRNVFVYNPDLTSGVNTPTITLASECWDSPPKIVQRGDSEFATELIAYGGDGSRVKVSSPNIIIEQYGLVQRTIEFRFIQDPEQLARAAESALAVLSQPFYIDETTSASLLPKKACPFDQLLPGLLVNAQIRHLCFEFNSVMRIQNVQNCINGDVKIGLEPVGSLL